MIKTNPLLTLKNRLVRAWRQFKCGKKDKPWKHTLLKKFNASFKKPAPIKGRVPVSSKLGKLFYERTFPRWVLWNNEEPNVLYINIDLVSNILKRQLDLPAVDEVLKNLAFMVAVDILKNRNKVLLGTAVEFKEFRDKTVIPFRANNWLSTDKILKLRDF